MNITNCRFVRRVSNEVQKALGNATAVAEERLSDIRSVKAFRREDWEKVKYSECVSDIEDGDGDGILIPSFVRR